MSRKTLILIFCHYTLVSAASQSFVEWWEAKGEWGQFESKLNFAGLITGFIGVFAMLVSFGRWTYKKSVKKKKEKYALQAHISQLKAALLAAETRNLEKENTIAAMKKLVEAKEDTIQLMMKGLVAAKTETRRRIEKPIPERRFVISFEGTDIGKLMGDKIAEDRRRRGTGSLRSREATEKRTQYQRRLTIG